MALQADCPDHGTVKLRRSEALLMWLCAVSPCMYVITDEAMAESPDGGDMQMWVLDTL